MTRYIVDWSDDDGNVDHIEVADLKEGKAKAATKSLQYGMAYVVAIDAAGESVGAIGYARGRQDTKEGVLK